MNNNLSELQKKLLDLLKWFHQVCVENNLTYYLEGGTMLGAVRHSGFIPWDDDLDICMPREDYEKFNSLFGNKTFDFIYVENPNSENKDFIYGFTKIYDLNTTLVEDFKTPIKRGVYIDVFPIDGCGNNLKESKKIYNKIHRKRILVSALNCSLKKKYPFYIKILLRIFRLLFGKILNTKKIVKKINDLALKYRFDNCEMSALFWGAWKYKDIISSKYFGKPKLYEFEGLKVYGVEFFDEYLTSVYGDWRTLPPIEKRVSHHNFVFIDLNKSYKID